MAVMPWMEWDCHFPLPSIDLGSWHHGLTESCPKESCPEVWHLSKLKDAKEEKFIDITKHLMLPSTPGPGYSKYNGIRPADAAERRE